MEQRARTAGEAIAARAEGGLCCVEPGGGESSVAGNSVMLGLSIQRFQ